MNYPTEYVGYPKKYKANEVPAIVFKWIDLLLPLLIEGDHPVHNVLREQYKDTCVLEICFSGVGCFIEFEVPADTPLTKPSRITGGFAEIEFEGSQFGAGSILFVNDGRLDFLEIYTYGEEWPANAIILGQREERRFRMHSPEESRGKRLSQGFDAILRKRNDTDLDCLQIRLVLNLIPGGPMTPESALAKWLGFISCAEIAV